jgi:putative tricarboxylic transport membrane protein
MAVSTVREHEHLMGKPWKPERAIDIVAGTPPGGGLDRVARALARSITDARLLDVPIAVVNVPGDGARRAWAHVDRYRSDAHVIAISSPNLTSDYLVGLASFDHSRYTPIASLVTEYIAFAVASHSPLMTGVDLLRRLGQGAASITVALSTALGNPNHIAFAKVTRSAGGAISAPSVRVFDTALDAVADVVAGNADVCAVTAASVLAEMKARRLRVLAISAPARLVGAFADAPTWNEQSVDCVVGAWRGVTGAADLTSEQIAFWEDILRAASVQPSWREELARLSWSAMYQDRAALREFLAREREEFSAVLGDLGLFKAPILPATS